MLQDLHGFPRMEKLQQAQNHQHLHRQSPVSPSPTKTSVLLVRCDMLQDPHGFPRMEPVRPMLHQIVGQSPSRTGSSSLMRAWPQPHGVFWSKQKAFEILTCTTSTCTLSSRGRVEQGVVLPASWTTTKDKDVTTESRRVMVVRQRRYDRKQKGY